MRGRSLSLSHGRVAAGVIKFCDATVSAIIKFCGAAISTIIWDASGCVIIHDAIVRAVDKFCDAIVLTIITSYDSIAPFQGSATGTAAPAR